MFHSYPTLFISQPDGARVKIVAHPSDTLQLAGLQKLQSAGPIVRRAISQLQRQRVRAVHIVRTFDRFFAEACRRHAIASGGRVGGAARAGGAAGGGGGGGGRRGGRGRGGRE